MRRAALLLVLLAGVLVAPASAAATPGATVAEDLVIAEAWWQRPISQCSELVINTEPREAAAGDATRPYPGYYGPCEMAVRAGYTPQQTCLIVVHEYGHLLGEGHSEDPASVMNPGQAFREPAIVPACQEPHPAATASPTPATAPLEAAPAPKPPHHPRRHARHHQRFHRGASI